MYLNGVYLGHHSYGVQAAAENYYRKNVEDLTLEEAALIAGLPQAPSRYSPFSHPEAEGAPPLRRAPHGGGGLHSQEDRARASEAEVKVLGWTTSSARPRRSTWSTARRHVVARYGNERLLHEGLRVELAMDLEKQRAAQGDALRAHGGRSPPGLRRPGRERLGRGAQGAPSQLARAWPKGSSRASTASGSWRGSTTAPPWRRSRWARAAGLPVSGMRWARRPNPEVFYPDALIDRPSIAARKDVVLLRRVTREQLQKRDKARGGQAGPRARRGAALLARAESQAAGRARLGRPVDRLRGRDGGRLRLRRLRVQPRVPGLPPAGLGVQPLVYAAAIEKLDHAGDDPHRRADRVPRRREQLEAAELRPGLQGRRDA